jgi:hypothetical protein
MDAEFGCERCYRNDDASAVWDNYTRSNDRGLVEVRTIEEDSHFSIRIQKCAACNQFFVWVFNEIVDWNNGDDSADISVLPIFPVEDVRAVDMEYLHSLGESRRWLHHSYGGGYKSTTLWRSGRLAVWG